MKAITIIAILFLYMVAGAGTAIAANSHVDSVSASTPNGSYNAGDTISITVTFNRSETVTGTPRIRLETGTEHRYANYVGGTGTNKLTFNYIVISGDTSSDLNYVNNHSLTLNSGNILNGSNNANLALPNTNDANSLGSNKDIVIDTTAPNSHIDNKTINGNNATFNFSSTESGSTFQCRLDGSDSNGYSPCSSPQTYSSLAGGKHTFYVKATDAAGNTEKSPESYKWNVPPKVDSDHDGLNDDEEAHYGTDKDDSDSDNDGVEDGKEIEHGTDPNNSDSDCDGISDGDEDKDNDGVNDHEDSDPKNPDHDNDGINDGDDHDNHEHHNSCNNVLNLTKSADPTEYSSLNQEINYTYVVNNTGNVSVSGPFKIHDNKIGNFTCGSATTTLAPGVSISCIKSYNVNQGDMNVGSITNTAQVVYPFYSNIARVIIGMPPGNTPIPEFPTVALPIAAVIGMVFLFQRRKNKE